MSFARQLDASTARLVAEGEGLLAGLAVPAVAEPERSADELREVVESHGFAGVMLPSSVATRQLDDPAFEPLFAVIEAMDLMAFMHPTG